MASIYKHCSGAWYVVFSLPSKRRAQLSLGRVTKNAAENVARKVAALLAANRIGEPPPAEVVGWLSILAAAKSPLLDRLGELGCLQSWARPTDAPTLESYWLEYLEKRRDFKPGTLKGWKTAWRHVSAAFPNATLASITPADAKQFARDLQLAVASSHASKIVERVGQVFAHAIDSRLIESNPFAGCRVTARVDKTRYREVPEPVALKVLDSFSNLEGRALFALARWCGLRVPCEPMVLQWSHVDWENERLNIPRAKTAARVCPLFEIPLRELRTLYDSAPDGATWIFSRARGSAATTWRQWLETACRAAGVPQWPDLWHNLRRSCRTELEDLYPTHVCNAWIGHSSRVAAKSYLLITAEHWEKAKLERLRRAPEDTAPSGTDGNRAE